jgi:uroporphyrinogen decarboxylase
VSTPNFLRACRGEPVDRVPVWFMRQAGRSLPEYRAIRGEGSILDAIADPDRAAEITLQPVRRYGVDAAIVFSDIMVPAHAIGFGVDIEPGVGPVCARPFSSAADLARVRPFEPDVDAPYVAETVRALVSELDVPLIGFAGAPFTVASYLIEGRPSRNYELTKALMYSEPKLWHDLMERLADIAIASLRDQIAAGATALQLFDSWAGALDEADYREFVFPHSNRVLASCADLGVPRIAFGVHTGELLSCFSELDLEVVGVDWRVPLDEATRRIGPTRSVQGNLDPTVLFGPWERIARRADDVLKRGSSAPGHVFNLGHGVLPSHDPEVLEKLVGHVHAWTP